MIACAGAALSACITPRERQAYEVYALRTEVLVGAQSCRMTDRFNVFATKFTRELTTEGRALRAHYLKTYGKGGDKALDDFVTRMANNSFVEGSGGGNLCAATTAIFEDVEALPEGQLAVYSSQHTPRGLPALEVCPTTRVAAAKKN
ncbi:MAG TPA: hypothetical protein VHT04_00010 [Stellaceae bacterium]|nr:hypothetical protein [Stellaceae bacterium]